MRAVLIKDGMVTTAVEIAPNWDQPDAGRDAWTPPKGVEVILSDAAGTGWTWDGNIFAAPPPGPDAIGDPLPPPRDLAAEIDALKATLAGKGIL